MADNTARDRVEAVDFAAHHVHRKQELKGGIPAGAFSVGAAGICSEDGGRGFYENSGLPDCTYRRADAFRHGFEFRLRAGGQHDFRPFLGADFGHRNAESFAGTCDDDDFISEPHKDSYIKYNNLYT
jgi:hypothetical protein